MFLLAPGLVGGELSVEKGARTSTFEHVLAVFMRHLADGAGSPEPLAKLSVLKEAFIDEIQELAAADCDEEILGR